MPGNSIIYSRRTLFYIRPPKRISLLPRFPCSLFLSILSGHKVDREEGRGEGTRARFRDGENIVSRRALKGNPSTTAARSKNDKGTPEGKPSSPEQELRFPFPVLPEYRSTNGIETVWGYTVRGGNGNSIVRSDCGRGTARRPATSERGSWKTDFFPAPSFSSISFLLFSLFSINERRNSGIIGLYVSPPRQYTRSHTFLRREPIPAPSVLLRD